MRRPRSHGWAWLGLLSSIACARGPAVEATHADAGAAAVLEPIVDEPATAKLEPEPDRAPEPVPVPSLVLVDEDWVLDDGDPAGPLVRIMQLDTTRDDDPEPIRALLTVLDPLLHCYQMALGRDPGLGPLTLTMRRVAPTDVDPLGLSLAEDVAKPTRVPMCAAAVLAHALPPHDQDPHGRYTLRFFGHRDQAPSLPEPELGDRIVEREGGACFVRREYPCKPHKRCKAPSWERARCPDPADRPGVALRWALGPPAGKWWPRVGIELVGADDTLVWRTTLDPDDTERLGPLHEDEAQHHLEWFRSTPLAGAISAALEPTRIVLVDRAGVREYERRTGELRFHYVPVDPEAPRMWFDEGTFTARKGKLRCTGNAGHGAFATRCGDTLLYFDGHALAAIHDGPPMFLHDQTTRAAKSSTRSGGAARPKATLRVAGWRVAVQGKVFLH